MSAANFWILVALEVALNLLVTCIAAIKVRRANLRLAERLREQENATKENAARVIEAKADQLEQSPPVLLGWSVTQAKIRVLRQGAAAIRDLARTIHPDAGGDRVAWDQLTHAYEQGKEENR